jgi:hypothetical protein
MKKKALPFPDRERPQLRDETFTDRLDCDLTQSYKRFSIQSTHIIDVSENTQR